MEQTYQNDIARAKELIGDPSRLSEVENNKAFVATFLAKSIVNLHVASEATYKASQQSARFACEDINARLKLSSVWALRPDTALSDAWGPVQAAIRSNDWYDAPKKAANNTSDVVQISARGDVQHNAWYAALSAVTKSTQDGLALLGIIDETKRTVITETEMGEKAYHLSELFSRNWVRKESAPYFRDVYHSAFEKLDGSISIEKASAIIDAALNEPKLVSFWREMSFWLHTSSVFSQKSSFTLSKLRLFRENFLV